MINLKQYIQEREEGIKNLIGEVPERAIMQMYGKEFCIMCGHPTQADKAVKELFDFHLLKHPEKLQNSRI